MRPSCLLRVALVVLSLCYGCVCRPPPIATLSSGEGVLWRDYLTAINAWETAAIGATFEIGEAFRTGPDATALLTLDDDTRLKVQPATTVRFQRQLSASKTAAVVVEGGTVVVETAEVALSLQTELGPAIISPRAVVRWERRQSGSRLSVDLGTAQLDPEGANERHLAKGEFLDITIGAAIVDSVASQVAPPAPSPVQTSEALDSNVVTMVIERGPVIVRSAGRSIRLTDGTHALTPPGSVRLGLNAQVRLTNQGRTVTLRAPGTYTFNDGRDFVRASKGAVDLRSDGSDTALAVPGGWVIATQTGTGSLVDIERHGQRTEVFVRKGKGTVIQGQFTEELTAGEGAHLDGKVVFVRGRSIATHDVTVRAGDSPVIHNPHAQTAVGFSVAEQCRGVGLVEIVSGSKVKAWAAAAGRVNLTLSSGVHTYRVRCLSEAGDLSTPQTSGRVTLAADSGGLQLPRTAPSNVVRADGRKYTLLYQNRLPSVTLLWANAPPAEAYTLSVTSRGRVRTLKTSAPQYTFSSGSLSEGEHTVSFVSASGRSSRVSVVDIQFDNVAPKASITSPESGSFAPGEEVVVGGIALPGWDVTVQGRAMNTDDQGRFSGKVVADTSGVSFLFSSPGRGVHQYLRRARMSVD
jgi:hypothetical protein